MAPDAAGVRAALDAEAGRRGRLADSDAFRTASRRIPADHVAAVYLDLQRLGPVTEQLDGYRTAELALVIERDALRLSGSAPFDAEAASELGRQQFALASEPSGLSAWMPADTRAEAVLFGVAQTLISAESAIGATPGLEAAADALTQLRALAALGLGINLDADLLPLLDRDAGIAIQQVDDSLPRGQLLLRPSDPAGAEAALGRVRDALEGRGASVSTREAAGTTITIVRVPEIGSVSWADARRGGRGGTRSHRRGVCAPRQRVRRDPGHDRGYRRPWELTGVRAGNELYLDVGWLVDALGGSLSLPDDGRDILHAISALAITAPAHDGETEFHLVLTAR